MAEGPHRCILRRFFPLYSREALIECLAASCGGSAKLRNTKGVFTARYKITTGCRAGRIVIERAERPAWTAERRVTFVSYLFFLTGDCDVTISDVSNFTALHIWVVQYKRPASLALKKMPRCGMCFGLICGLPVRAD